jgi:hypothetical protein
VGNSRRGELEASASSGRAGCCFWAFRSSFLAFSFLVFGSWALLVRALLVLGIASQGVAGPGHCWSWSLRSSSGPGGFRLTRFLRVVASELLLASCSWRAVAGWLF